MSFPVALISRQSVRLALLSLGLLASAPCMAQPTPMMPAPPPSLPGGGGPVQQVPLDGGLGLLALAGSAYAVRRLRQHNER